MHPSDWARTHIGETILARSGIEHLMATDTGIVVKIGLYNIAVDVTDDGWVLRLILPMPSSWELSRLSVPAIYVPQTFLMLCEHLAGGSSHTA